MKKWLVILASSALIVILVVAAYSRFSNLKDLKEEKKEEEKVKRELSAEARTTQIYPNYVFQEGVNQIKVPLIPTNQLLSYDAGGWVITPDGSEWIVDHKVAINIEFIDGRKVYCEPHKPIYVGVRPANRIFRIYGSERDTVSVSITRGVY